MKAILKHYRQSPRKVRLVANAVKGKRLVDAHVTLAHMPKRAAEPMQKLIKSAAANAQIQGINTENLIIENIEVNKGLVMKRWMPRAQGRATPIRKKTSHVRVVLGEKRIKKATSASKAAVGPLTRAGGVEKK